MTAAESVTPALRYDIIGDVHGRMDKLEALLQRLGYTPDGAGYTPPPGHKALFLGDLIDTKPGYDFPGGVRATLTTVKAMCEAGAALCLMGNHELNAIFYHTRGPEGHWLRPHGSMNKRTHHGTLEDFPDHREPDGEWLRVWLPWLMELPFYLDLGGFRAVHACWHPPSIALLAGKKLTDEAFFHQVANHHTPEGTALELLLKGVEILLPEGVSYQDQMGVRRGRIRARWWQFPVEGMTFHDFNFPPDSSIPHQAVPTEIHPHIPGYGPDEPPVFFGHYLKPAEAPFLSEQHNVACLDHGASMDGPLICYRWQGESQLSAEHFTSHVHEMPVAVEHGGHN